MERLKKAYEALDLLQAIDIPISTEQKNIVAQLEKDYLREEVIPLFEQEMLPLVENMRNSFELEVTYSKDEGLDITLVEHSKIQAQINGSDQPSRKQKKYIIRVIFPDNHVSCNKMVLETLLDVVRYAGPRNVQKLGINIMRGNLVSSELNENERYRIGQKEIEPGLYVCTYSSTDTKYDQIKTINRLLKLGLKIEKQML